MLTNPGNEGMLRGV
jgi:heat shock protein beta